MATVLSTSLTLGPSPGPVLLIAPRLAATSFRGRVSPEFGNQHSRAGYLVCDAHTEIVAGLSFEVGTLHLTVPLLEVRGESGPA